MNPASLARLVTLAAIWGGSFLFMRMGAPVLGPVPLIALRVGLAALFLAAIACWLRRPPRFARHWKHYLVLGFLNSALPFVLFAWAAQTLSASLMSILNATSPIWGAVIGAVQARQVPSARIVSGLALGVAGVGVLVGFDAAVLRPGAGAAIAATLGAACSYGFATAYAKSAASVDPFDNAHGTMWAATLLLVPLLPLVSPPAMPGPAVMAAVVALGVVCSGVAYLLYFRLVADLGPASALTVTFLVPVFGVLWGALLLDEPVGWQTLAGAAIVVSGTALVTGLRMPGPRSGSGAAPNGPA